MMKLPDIPQSWLIMGLMVGLIVLRYMNIDSWTTAALSTLMGYLVGVKLEQIRGCGATSPQEIGISMPTATNEPIIA